MCSLLVYIGLITCLKEDIPCGMFFPLVMLGNFSPRFLPLQSRSRVKFTSQCYLFLDPNFVRPYRYSSARITEYRTCTFRFYWKVHIQWNWKSERVPVVASSLYTANVSFMLMLHLQLISIHFLKYIVQKRRICSIESNTANNEFQSI